MKNKYDLIIFDLDGTILDTSLGIFNSVRYAEKMMNFEPVTDEVLKKFVGPPPKEMYKKIYNVSEDKALLAAKYHREYGRTHAIYEAKVYPKIIEVLDSLKKDKIKLAVATLKSQNIAEEILQYFDLDKFFDVIVGMDEKETLTKADTIRISMEKVGIKDNVLMIGDSKYDELGAKEINVDFISVLYGFGFNKDNKTEFFIENIKDIFKYL